MRKRKTLKPLLKTCPQREEDGASSADGDSATDEEDAPSIVIEDTFTLRDDHQLSTYPSETSNDESVETVFEEVFTNGIISTEKSGNAAFVKASSFRHQSRSLDSKDGSRDLAPFSSISLPARSTSVGSSADRFALKSNVISIPNPVARKSKKRKLKPVVDDGRKQTSINSFFTSKPKPSVETLSPPSPARPESRSSATGSSDSRPPSSAAMDTPESSQSSQQGRTMRVSTLDGFVSPQKSGSGDVPSTSRDVEETPALPDAKRQKIEEVPRPEEAATASSSQPVASNSGDAVILGEKSKSRQDSDEGPMGVLPDEILERIFCQIPHGGTQRSRRVLEEYESLTEFLVKISILSFIPDLVLHSTRVCKRWNDIITCPSFMPFKKLYYAYKKSSGEQYQKARDEIHDLMIAEGMTGFGSCFLGFIRW